MEGPNLASLSTALTGLLASFLETRDVVAASLASKQLRTVYTSETVTQRVISARNTVLWLCCDEKHPATSRHVRLGRTAQKRPPRLMDKVGRYGFDLTYAAGGSRQAGAIQVKGPRLDILDIVEMGGSGAGAESKEVGVSSFTVEAMVCLHALAREDWKNPIVSKHGHGKGWELRVDPARGPWFIMTLVQGPHIEIHAKTHGIPLNKWVSIGASFDATERAVRLFVNRRCVHKGQIPPYFWSGWESARARSSGFRRAEYPNYSGHMEIGRNPEWHDRATDMSVAEVIVSRYARH